MSLIKTLTALVVITFLAIGAFAIYGLYNLDQIIKDSITQIGSETTQTKVTLSEATISLRSGEGQLNGLQINNPQGYKSPYAFSLDQIKIVIDPQSIMDKVVIIREINISGASLIAEEQGFKRLNLHQLHKNIIEKIRSQPQHPTEDEQTEQKRFMIEKLILSDNNLRLVTEKFGEKNLPFPAFTVTDIGDKEEGLSAEELAPAIMDPILSQATQSVKNALKSLAGSHGKDALKKMAEKRLGLD
jgi:uncharacterized protein involved in outer membrane biogenesis